MSMDHPQENVIESPPAIESDENPVDMLFDRRRVTFIGIVLIGELALFILAIVVPADPNLRQELVAQGQNSLPPLNTSARALVGLIVANNLRVALLEMIPVVGLILLPISIFTSGVIVQGFAISKAVPPAVAAFSYLLLPFTYVELSAYAVAFVSGTMIIVAWRKKRLHREARVFVVELAAVAVILAVAATMETITIFSPVAGLLLWLPLAGAMVLVAIKTVKSKS